MNNINETKKIFEGIKLITDKIALGYGPNGINTIIETDEYPFIKITNDAYTIIHSIETTDRVQLLGLNVYKGLMDKQNFLSGDGRKTAALMCGACLDGALQSEIPKIKLKKQLSDYIPVIEKMIDEESVNIDIDSIGEVATVSGESKELGGLLQEIYKKIGKDGVIEVESSGTPYTTYNFVEGVKFNAGYANEALAHDNQAVVEGKKEIRAVYENPTILVTRKKINTINEIDPLIQKLINEGKKELVIFYDDMDITLLSSLIKTHKAKLFNILLIKAPVLFKEYVYEDFAQCVGATIVENHDDFKKLNLNYLGTCDKIITTKEETLLLGISDISQHIQELKNNADNDSLLRVRWLSNKNVILKIGGDSEEDIYYKRMKAQDAVNACKLALQGGVIVGAGFTLAKIADKIDNDIIRKTLKAPYEQLLTNNKNEPIDTTDIWDASIVIKNAVRSAIGLASITITIGLALIKSNSELKK